MSSRKKPGVDSIVASWMRMHFLYPLVCVVMIVSTHVHQ